MLSVRCQRPQSFNSFWSEETKINNDNQVIDRDEITTIASSSSSPLSNRYQIVKKICRRATESYREFIKRASSEYCITSVLSHTNVVNAKDMIMKEYHFELVLNLEDPGISLYDLIHSTHLNHPSLNDYMYQLCQSIHYLHSIGIAHRDIQLKNILIMPDHTLKLSNFSSADVFRQPCQKKKRQSHGKVGLIEYQPPETLFYYHHSHQIKKMKKQSSSSSSSQLPQPKKNHGDNDEDDHHYYHFYWATSLDIWSCGIVLFYLWQKKFPWSLSCHLHDMQFRSFLQAYPISYHHDGDTIPCLQFLPTIPRRLIYKMLNPDPTTRISMDQLLNDYHL